MRKYLLAGAAIVFAGIAATVAVAAEYKPARHAAPVPIAKASVKKPTHAMATSISKSRARKASPHRRHSHAVRKHHRHGHAHPVHRAK